MGTLREILAWLTGEGFCPSCDSSLHAHEAGYRECDTCGVIVDYENGRWKFCNGEWRRLPGMAGIPFEEKV